MNKAFRPCVLIENQAHLGQAFLTHARARIHKSPDAHINHSTNNLADDSHYQSLEDKFSEAGLRG